MEGDIITKDIATANQLANTLLHMIQQNTKKIDQLTVDLEKIQQIDFRTLPGGYS